MVRKIWLATAAIAGLAGAATPAMAQRVWQDGRWVSMPHRSGNNGVTARHASQRWPMVNGRWSAGWKAPGGWNSYRRLNRGSRVDRYWMDYRIPDYLSFGLAAPPRGYNWVRYYDDAVLVDDYGQVWDSVGGIGWDGAEAYADGYSASSYAGAGTSYQGPIEPVDPNGYYDGPQGGGPVGPSYDAPIPYPAPYPGGYAPRPAPAAPVIHVESYPAGGYQGGGYQGGAFLGGNAYQGSSSYYSSGYGYAGGGTTTTVIINPAPITTTTVVEEVVEERVSTSYVRVAPRRVVRKAPVKRWRPKAKCCVCGC